MDEIIVDFIFASICFFCSTILSHLADFDVIQYMPFQFQT